MSQSRQLAAILFTDIVGYTALMQENEQAAVGLIKHYNTTLNKTVGLHHGKVLNYYGDGSLCSFTSVREALNCALEIQRDLQSAPSVPLRIGLHIGEVFFEEDKALGDGVNIASRIQSLGQANTILFSKEIADKISNQPEFRSVSLGLFEFKNVIKPIEVFALENEGLTIPKREAMSGKLKEVQKTFFTKKIILAAIFVLLLFAGFLFYKIIYAHNDIPQNNKTIAVLPFKNISSNIEENEPFCAGVALELQRKLEWLGGLIPIASQSVEKYRDTKMSILDIAKELGGISYILQGSVQRDKNKIKVFAALIDARTGKELWSNDYPGEMEDIFSLQENIAQQIASALQVKISTDEQSRLGRVATKSAAAIDAYNEALFSYVKLASSIHPLYWDSLSSNSQLYSAYQHTLSLCNKAINTDPLMAEAYVLKGQTYLYSITDWFTTVAKSSQIFDSVKVLGNNALGIDRSSTDAYLILSKCPGDSVLNYLEKAFAINSNNFDVNRQLGEYYRWTDPERSIQFLKKAIRLNPLSMWTPDVYTELGLVYNDFGDFEKAEAYGKKAIELSSNSIMKIEATRWLVTSYLHWGQADSAIKYGNLYDNENPNKEINANYEIAEAYCNLKNDCVKAAQLYEEVWRRYPNRNNPQRWAVALMNIGKTKEAKEKINMAIKEYIERNDTLSYDYAGICSLNGDKEKAMEILRKCKWQWGTIYLIQHDKLFDNLRNEKEFKDIVKKALDDKTRLRKRISMMEESGKL
jgi:TolB-like protein/class 3 adenylate cyclase/TolA-binding protein